jgi:hypothetical protein
LRLPQAANSVTATATARADVNKESGFTAVLRISKISAALKDATPHAHNPGDGDEPSSVITLQWLHDACQGAQQEPMKAMPVGSVSKILTATLS